MTGIINIRKDDNFWAGLILSVLLHALILAGFIMIMNFSIISAGGGGGYLEVSSEDIVSADAFEKQEIHKPEKPIENVSKQPSNELVEKIPSKEKEKRVSEERKVSQSNSAPGITNTPGRGKYLGFSSGAGDTTALQQVYSEKTLNVKINYPVGWRFLDQNKKNRLDGVTFWADNGVFNPPPYIFLEVKEKYSFNPNQYKFKTEIRNAVIYYNDPEELENQVSQVFYFRTEDDEDYSIKLIVTGKDAFAAFQPVFFGMIKTFKFGKSWF